MALSLSYRFQIATVDYPVTILPDHSAIFGSVISFAVLFDPGSAARTFTTGLFFVFDFLFELSVTARGLSITINGLTSVRIGLLVFLFVLEFKVPGRANPRNSKLQLSQSKLYLMKNFDQSGVGR